MPRSKPLPSQERERHGLQPRRRWAHWRDGRRERMPTRPIERGPDSTTEYRKKSFKSSSTMPREHAAGATITSSIRPTHALSPQMTDCAPDAVVGVGRRENDRDGRNTGNAQGPLSHRASAMRTGRDCERRRHRSKRLPSPLAGHLPACIQPVYLFGSSPRNVATGFRTTIENLRHEKAAPLHREFPSGSPIISMGDPTDRQRNAVQA